MAANISKNGSVIEFGRLASSATPWWGEGQIVADGFANDARGFARESRMDFEIDTVPHKFDKLGKLIECEKKDCVMQSVFRTDNGNGLSIVGPQWTPHNFVDSCPFLQSLLDTGKATVSTMGALGSGERQWATLAFGDLEVVKGDNVKNYLLHVVNNQVGSVGNYVTSVRTVCENTMRAGIAASNRKMRIWHGKDVTANVKLACEIIDVETQEFAATIEQWQKLAKATLCKADLEKFVKKLFDVSDSEKISSKKLNQIEKIVSLAFNGKGNNGATLWDAVNGVTDYYSHHAGHNPATRLESTWFGSNAKTIEKAFAIAFDMLAS